MRATLMCAMILMLFIGCKDKGPSEAQQAECRQSNECKWHGKCTADEDGECINTTDADCKAATTCNEHGKCSTWYHKAHKNSQAYGTCGVRSHLDCKGADPKIAAGPCFERDECFRRPMDGGVCITKEQFDRDQKLQAEIDAKWDAEREAELKAIRENPDLDS